MEGLAGSQINVEIHPAIAVERKIGRHHIAFFRAIILGMVKTRKQQTDVVPLESFIVPSDLGGRSNSNQHPGVPRIDAPYNYRAAFASLTTKSRSPNTQRAYQNEAEKNFLWSILERGKAMSDLTVESCASYQDWLSMIGRAKPGNCSFRVAQSEWIGAKKIGWHQQA